MAIHAPLYSSGDFAKLEGSPGVHDQGHSPTTWSSAVHPTLAFAFLETEGSTSMPASKEEPVRLKYLELSENYICDFYFPGCRWLLCCSGSFLPVLVHFPVGFAENYLPSSPTFTPTPTHTLFFLFFLSLWSTDQCLPQVCWVWVILQLCGRVKRTTCGILSAVLCACQVFFFTCCLHVFSF